MRWVPLLVYPAVNAAADCKRLAIVDETGLAPSLITEIEPWDESTAGRASSGTRHIWLSDYTAGMIPAAVKIAHTLFVCLFVPVYWHYYGPQNFLWFSDIALLTSIVALWRRSSLLASTQALSVMALEIGWTVDFLGRLILGRELLGLSGYMFDPSIPLFVRLLSLFHLWLPWLLVWMIWRFGYDRRAMPVQTLLCWIVLPASYFISTPEENINWVYGLASHPQTFLPAAAYLLLLMAAIPLCVYLPTHLLLRRLARRG
jgi:hypothetical protein